MNKLSYSFDPGYKKIPIGAQNDVKSRLSEIIGAKNRHVFSRKKHSIVNISKVQYDEVTALFAEYGISEEEVWNITECIEN